MSGDDVGGAVAEVLASERPDRVTALRLTNIAAQRALGADRTTLPPDALADLDRHRLARCRA